MSDPLAPPPPPESTPPFGPPGFYPPMPPPPMAYTQPAGAPVLGIVAIVLAVLLAPIGCILGIITLATAKGRKSAKILGWFAVGVGLVITAIFVVAIVFVVNGIHDAENVSNQFMNDLQNQNVPAAYALTSSGFQATTSESQLANVVTQVGDVFSEPRHIVSSRLETSTSVGTYTDIVYEADGTQTTYIDVRLVKQGGNWRVLFVGPTTQP